MGRIYSHWTPEAVATITALRSYSFATDYPTNLPETRTGHAAVVVNGRLHALGGTNGTTASEGDLRKTGRVWAPNAWTNDGGGDLVYYLRQGLDYHVGQGKLYLLTGPYLFLASQVYRYPINPTNGQRGPFEAVTTMPYTSGGNTYHYGATLCLDEAGGALFLHREYTGRLYRFDLGTNVWTERATSPKPAAYSRPMVVRGLLYQLAIDVEKPGGDQAQLLVYDPSSNTWGTISTPPGIVTAHQIGYDALTDSLIFAGGVNIAGTISNAWAYSFGNGAWTEITGLPWTADKSAIACDGAGTVYVTGGGNINGVGGIGAASAACYRILLSPV